MSKCPGVLNQLYIASVFMIYLLALLCSKMFKHFHSFSHTVIMVKMVILFRLRLYITGGGCIASISWTKPNDSSRESRLELEVMIRAVEIHGVSVVKCFAASLEVLDDWNP